MGKIRQDRTTSFAYGLGLTTRSPAGIGRLYNFVNARDGNLGAQGFWNIVNPIPPVPPVPPPPPVYNNLAVGLLDFTYQSDINVKNNLQWFFTNVPFLYEQFQIIDVKKEDNDKTLQLLDYYYSLGTRYFVLSSFSGNILICIPWFQKHPDVVGFSANAQSQFLDIPKKIYNLSPLIDQKLILYSYAGVIPYDVIYLLYIAGDPFGESTYEYLQKYCNTLGKIFKPIAWLTDSSGNRLPFNTTNLNTVMSDVSLNEVASIITAYGAYTQEVYNSFDVSSTPYTGYPFYQTSQTPILSTTSSAQYFVQQGENNLYTTSSHQANLSVSYLWQLNYQNFTTTTYNPVILSILQMIYNGSIPNKNINDLASPCDIMSYNYVNKTNNGLSLLVYQFTYINNNKLYTPQIIYYKNENGQLFSAPITNYTYNPVTAYTILPPSGPTKTAAALLELNGNVDRDILETLYYLWSSTTNFIQMPIYDTSGNVDITLQLLQQCYDNGIRLFLGFSRSTMLNAVLGWFNTHPDAIGVSTFSTADTLSIQKNIYRLQTVDSFILQTIEQVLETTIQNSGKIYYVYSSGELAATNVLTYLNNTYGIGNVLGYAATTANLTVSDLNTFYTGITSNDIIVIYLFVGTQHQDYINLFDASLNSPCINIPTSQYDISQEGFPIITLSTTTLNNLYHVLVSENITTSALWSSAFTYLDNSFSPNTLNALYMLTQFSQNQSVYTLSSYNGALQFNEYNDIKYGSFAVYNYDDGYKINYIYCDDPLYKKLTFTPL